jgi:hypothetical protein
MSTPFDRALGVMSSRLRTLAGVSVTYARGTTDSVTVMAIAGTSTEGVTLGDGSQITARVTDWIIEVADLLLNDEQATPARGDTIVVTEGGRVNTYEVVDVGGQPCARLAEGGKTWRIHTQLIDSQSGT